LNAGYTKNDALFSIIETTFSHTALIKSIELFEFHNLFSTAWGLLKRLQENTIATS